MAFAGVGRASLDAASSSSITPSIGQVHMYHSTRLLSFAALLCMGSLASAQDAAAGKTAFATCSGCHSVEARNGVGPSLQGVVGRKAGSFPGFHYSEAMKAAAIWDARSLDAFIANPQHAVPGNTMPFPGVSDAKVRADIVAYLGTLK
jgi:cytochrome c